MAKKSKARKAKSTRAAKATPKAKGRTSRVERGDAQTKASAESITKPTRAPVVARAALPPRPPLPQPDTSRSTVPGAKILVGSIDYCEGRRVIDSAEVTAARVGEDVITLDCRYSNYRYHFTFERVDSEWRARAASTNGARCAIRKVSNLPLGCFQLDGTWSELDAHYRVEIVLEPAEA